MNKHSQSLLDFFPSLPLSSFMVPRSPISNKEAQSLYDIWTNGEKDEYGKYVIPDDIDPMHIASLTTKGYMTNQPGRFATRDLKIKRTCEFTNKAKDVIKKIILFKEKSALEKSSDKVDYEAICRSEILPKTKSASKVASKQEQSHNWLKRIWN